MDVTSYGRYLDVVRKETLLNFFGKGTENVEEQAVHILPNRARLASLTRIAALPACASRQILCIATDDHGEEDEYAQFAIPLYSYRAADGQAYQEYVQDVILDGWDNTCFIIALRKFNIDSSTSSAKYEVVSETVWSEEEIAKNLYGYGTSSS